jgi:hypothetical protein
MANTDDTKYVTGNSIKVEDMKAVLGEDISLFNTKINEIQGKPFDVSLEKIRTIYSNCAFKAVACEDTSFGHGKVASVVKDIIETCNENEGDLYNVIKAMAPKVENVKYTSIMSFKDDTFEALFECEMLCQLCSRSGKGTIDPFAIPLEYTVTQHVNGQKTVLIENQKIDNPEKLSISQQTLLRKFIHPRYFSLRAYDQWRRSLSVSVTK